MSLGALLQHWLTSSMGIFQPILVTAQSKAWVCDRTLAGIAGSNPAGGVDVCLL